MTGPAAAPGVGCRNVVVAVGWLIGLAAIEVALGLWLALSTPPIAERVGFALYAAGAPVSAGFAAVAGELPLAPFTDAIVWLVAGVGTASWHERTGTRLSRLLAAVAAVALVYGVAISGLIARV